MKTRNTAVGQTAVRRTEGVQVHSAEMTDQEAGGATVAMSSVAARSVTVRFRRRTALDDVSLSFGPGVHGLLGPNGAGKSTLIRVLATLVSPSTGSVELLGRQTSLPRDRTEIRRRLGYLPQSFGYYPRFTVREFVEYFAWLKQVPAREVPGAAERAIAEVGLSDRADDKLKTLSGGMLRRAGIAQAIVNSPELLLLDEPTAGLDPEQRVEFRSLVRRLGEHSSVLISTHLVEDVASACHDVAILYEGQVAYQGTASGLIASGNERPQPANVVIHKTDTDDDVLPDAASDGDAPVGPLPGSDAAQGVSPIERGYSEALMRHRARRGAGQ